MTPPIQQTPSASPRAGRRRAGAAGTARRSLERDLARREASLRINRRVSGPVGGVARPAPAPASTPVSQSFTSPPSSRAPQGRAAAAQVSAPIDVPEFLVAGRSAAPQPRPAVRPVARSSVAPGALRPVQPARGVRLVPTAGAAGAAAAVVTAPAPALAPAPRPALQTLRGGLTEERATGRLSSVPRMIVASVVMLVVTVGVVLATQIAMTQVNEQIGDDLGKISRLEQTNTALRERTSSQVAAAPVLGEARSRGLVEPEPGDVHAVRAGERELTAARAAKALRRAGSVAPATTAPSTSATTASTGTVAPSTAASPAGIGTVAPSTAASTAGSAAPVAAAPVAATGIAPTP